MKSFHGAGLQGGMGAAFPSAHATFPHFMPSSKGFPTMFMGHFGYIELPIPIYHPSHVNELKQIFSLVCLKCLRMKKGKQDVAWVTQLLSVACLSLAVKMDENEIPLPLHLQAHSHYSFGPLSAYLSVNYLDRFLSNYELPQDVAWVTQLLSVACLSLAVKMDENEIPLPLHLQVMGYADIDVAEFFYKKRPSVDELMKYLCNDLSKACSIKPLPVPKVPAHKNSGLPLNAYMLHNLAHVELNAINLAWDTVA